MSPSPVVAPKKIPHSCETWRGRMRGRRDTGPDGASILSDAVDTAPEAHTHTHARSGPGARVCVHPSFWGSKPPSRVAGVLSGRASFDVAAGVVGSQGPRCGRHRAGCGGRVRTRPDHLTTHTGETRRACHTWTPNEGACLRGCSAHQTRVCWRAHLPSVVPLCMSIMKAKV